ncbi:MAG TPA: hypothetical protein VGO55_10285 [Allosphingosinicella sp.]|nr:hypothetical protein [Allosphingosinicella sp.]
MFLFLAPVALGGWYVTNGSGGGGGFSQEVDKTPQQVIAQISDLDIRRQPGAPGLNPAASGGAPSSFRTERTAEGITFVVMSGNQVATRMIARLEPLDGGRRTRVTAEVVRGDAPDELIPPAFRSTGTTLGLFSAALRDELGTANSPPRRSLEECRQLEIQLLDSNPPTDSGLEAMRAIHRMSRELQSQGCNPGEAVRLNGPTQAPSARMGAAPPHAARGVPPPPSPSFEPGRPMVDVRAGPDVRR